MTPTEYTTVGLPDVTNATIAELAPLRGTRVAVTRPRHQAQPICQEINNAGGLAIEFPALEIQYIGDEQSDWVLQLGSTDWGIFISSNAVIGTRNILGAELPPQLALAAVGPSTAQAAEQLWQRPVLLPATQYNSEGLLALTQLQQLNGQKICIFRGQGGRELLAEELRHRGAQVHYAEVYKRCQPALDMAKLISAHPDVLLVTSNEALQNLFNMAGNSHRAWLLDQALVVISHRTAQLATSLGFKHAASIAKQADSQGLLQALAAWAQH